MNKETLIGIDCGSEMTGVVVLTESGIKYAKNVCNSLLVDFIKAEAEQCEALSLVIEDVRPYNMRITDGIIQTIKFLGQLEYRAQILGINYTLIPRWEVKRWVFNTFNEDAISYILNKIDKSKKRKEKIGAKISKRNQSPSFVYVDDQFIRASMRKYWQIERKKGKEKAPFGLKDHSWQALGLASCYISQHKPSFQPNLATF